MSSFVGAIAVADLVKTTLGPKGMDKILQSVRNQSALPPMTLQQCRSCCLDMIGDYQAAFLFSEQTE